MYTVMENKRKGVSGAESAMCCIALLLLMTSKEQVGLLLG